MREAVAELEDEGGNGSSPLDPRLLEHAPEALRILESAWRIQRAVLRRVLGETADRLSGAAPRASAR